jgi:two-component system, cell cycle response regulator DivK
MQSIDKRGQRRTILVVEDNALLQHAYCQILEAQDFRTIAASTGAEGLRLAREQRPNLILLDVMLPDMSGWEVQQRLARDAATASIPVVGLSAIGDPDAANHAMKIGFTTFLRKPVRMATLIGIVRSVIEPPTVRQAMHGSNSAGDGASS